MSWLFGVLLACAVLVLVGAEWPRLSTRIGADARVRRERTRRKTKLRVVRSERDEFAESVQRDLDRLPTIEEQERHR